MLSLKNVLLIACGIFTALSTFAQHGAGNGGHVIEDNGKLYLLDFFEGGTQSTPLHPNRPTDVETKRFIRRAQWRLESKQFDAALKSTLTDYMAYLLPQPVRDRFLAALDLYTWNFVDAPLKEVSELESIIDLSQYKVYVGAVRLDNAITISKKVWSRLDTWNKVGLIFHEVFYSMVRPTLVNGNVFEQRSWDARLINRSLLSEAGRNTRLYTFTRNGAPILTMFPSSPIHQDPEMTGDTLSYGVGTGIYLDIMPFTIISPKLRKDYDFTLNLSRSVFPAQDNAWLIKDLCDFINSLPQKKAYMMQAYYSVNVGFKDYQTNLGPNKFVDFTFEKRFAEDYGSQGPGPNDHYHTPGYAELSYPTVAACVSDVHNKIKETADALGRRYDFKEEYSNTSSKAGN